MTSSTLMKYGNFVASVCVCARARECGFYTYTGCVSESGDFVTLFFLVRQHWGECRYRHFAANFKAF
jgi:hypothetical protein